MTKGDLIEALRCLSNPGSLDCICSCPWFALKGDPLYIPSNFPISIDPNEYLPHARNPERFMEIINDRGTILLMKNDIRELLDRFDINWMYATGEDSLFITSNYRVLENGAYPFYYQRKNEETTYITEHQLYDFLSKELKLDKKTIKRTIDEGKCYGYDYDEGNHTFPLMWNSFHGWVDGRKFPVSAIDNNEVEVLFFRHFM